MPNNEFTKKYYKIREVAEIIGISPTTLRFWESRFPDINPYRTESNQRLYTPGDIESLRIVFYLLKVKGLKMETAIREFRHNKKNISKKIEVISELEHVKAELNLLLHSLNLRSKQLEI